MVLFLSELDIYTEPKLDKKMIIWKHSSSGDDNIKSKFVSVIILLSVYYKTSLPLYHDHQCVVEETYI